LRRSIYEGDLARWIHENPPPPGVRMHGNYPTQQFDPKSGKSRLAGVEPGREQEAERWLAAWGEAANRAYAKGWTDQAEELRKDWRPICSYVANLERMADALLDTDGAWVTLGRAVARSQKAIGGAFGPRRGRPGRGPQPDNERWLADNMVPQYPWQWSAGVLAGRLGLSTSTLTRRVQALDH